MKEYAARMENIPSTMVLQKHVYKADTIFPPMAITFVNNPLGGCLE